MPMPDFVRRLREHVGHAPLWLLGATAVVVRGDGQVLLVRRSDDGRWTPVTGIVDPGEHPAVAAVREAGEEAGVECEVEALVAVSVTEPVRYPNGDVSQYVDHTFRCRYVSGEARVVDGEASEVGWFDPDAMPAMDDEFVRRICAALDRAGLAPVRPGLSQPAKSTSAAGTQAACLPGPLCSDQ